MFPSEYFKMPIKGTIAVQDPFNHTISHYEVIGEDKKTYITNVWHKEYKHIPQLVPKDFVIKYDKKSIMIDRIMKEACWIEKQAKDERVINRIKMLWSHYKHNLDEFRKKLGETIKTNLLSFSADKNWLSTTLENITGDEWHLSEKDFTSA
jgi:uncharacterized protein (DUF1697 family)